MPLDDFQRVLALEMSAISEELYAAGWTTDLEYDLWPVVLGERTDLLGAEIHAEDIARLKRWQERCNGWIVYSGEDEERFVPIDEWVKMYEARQNSKRTADHATPETLYNARSLRSRTGSGAGPLAGAIPRFTHG